jgi:hypothetical protein
VLFHTVECIFNLQFQWSSFTYLYHIWNLPPPGFYKTYFPWSSNYLISYKSLKVLTSIFKHICICWQYFKVLTSIFKHASHLLTIFHNTWQSTFLQILAIYVWILSLFRAQWMWVVHINTSLSVPPQTIITPIQIWRSGRP